jgi:hypothetical protein
VVIAGLVRDVLVTGGMESLHNFAQKKISEHKMKDNFYAFDVGRLYRLHQVLLSPDCILRSALY